MTLPEFLLARIAEDEAAAATFPDDGEWGAYDDKRMWTTVGGLPIYAPRARVVAECEAKRQIIAHIDYHLEYSGDVTPASLDLAKTTIRAFALPYTDHPDYRKEWRP